MEATSKIIDVGVAGGETVEYTLSMNPEALKSLCALIVRIYPAIRKELTEAHLCFTEKEGNKFSPHQLSEFRMFGRDVRLRFTAEDY